jgi:aminoglycoside phosphotransferase (APT) family kinase protein/putative sterol carrier protein
MQARQMDADELQARLAGWLQRKMPGARGLALENMARSGAGFSNETMLFDAKWTEGEKALSRGMVLRTPPRAYPVFPEVALTKQFKVMKILGGTKVPVPRMLWLEEDPGPLGSPFYVMEKLKGTVVPEYPPYHTFGFYFNATPGQRARMWWGALENMARVHMLDWKKLGFSFLGVPGGGTAPVDRQIEYLDMYLGWMKEGDSQPIFEAALAWLKENRYAPERVTLCWGDPRLPNTMYNEETYDVVAILDWEMSFLGDPEADLAWFLFCDWQHSDGYGLPRTEGSPTSEETIRRYEEITGFRTKHLLYQEVVAALYFGIIMAQIFKNFKKMGVAMPGDASEFNTVGHQRLATLLNLAPPAAPQRQVTNVEQMTVTVQFHLTGPGGSDWYLVCDKGKAARFEGSVENPNCGLTVSAEDWAKMQRGELEKFKAWTDGKLKIDGDMTLFLQMEDIISKFTKGGG